MAMAMIKLYGYPRSRSTRIVWMLEELGIDYEFIKIDLLAGGGQSQDYFQRLMMVALCSPSRRRL